MKELIDSYQQLLTKIEERIVYLGNEMKLPQTKESLKQLPNPEAVFLCEMSQATK